MFSRPTSNKQKRFFFFLSEFLFMSLAESIGQKSTSCFSQASETSHEKWRFLFQLIYHFFFFKEGSLAIIYQVPFPTHWLPDIHHAVRMPEFTMTNIKDQISNSLFWELEFVCCKSNFSQLAPHISSLQKLRQPYRIYSGSCVSLGKLIS